MKTRHDLDAGIALLQRAGIHPVRGGSEAPAAAATDEGETFTGPNGEEVSREEWEDFKNSQNWRRDNEERSTAVKREAETVAKERAALAEERRTLALERQQQLEDLRDRHAASQEQEERESEELDLSNLPDASEEPERYRQELQNRMRTALANGQQRQAAEFEKKLKDATSQIEKKVTGQQAQERAYAANRKTCEDYFAELEREGNPVSADDQRRIMRHMDATMRVDGMGEVDASGVFRFSRDAVEAADYAARRDYWRNRDREQGFQDGLTQRRRNGQADQVLNSQGKAPPGKGASPAELWEYGSQLPPASQEAQAFFDNLSGEQLDAYIKEDRDRRVGQQLGEAYI